MSIVWGGNLSEFYGKLLRLEAQSAALSMSRDFASKGESLSAIKKNIAELYEQYVSKIIVVKCFNNGECAFHVFNKDGDFITEIYGSHNDVKSLSCYRGDDLFVNKRSSSNSTLSVSMRSNLLESIFVYVNDDVVYQGGSYAKASSVYRSQLKIIEAVKPQKNLENSKLNKLNISFEM